MRTVRCFMAVCGSLAELERAEPAALGISSKTVDNHRIKVLEKMGVDNATQLARLLLHAESPTLGRERTS